ncbi:MAG: hypothetical protein AB7F99_11010 [Vicinamibacterales bacterium]
MATLRPTTLLLVLVAAAVAAAGAARAGDPLAQDPPPQATAAEAAQVEEFNKRVQALLDLRSGIEKGTPPVSDTATPDEIDRAQRGLESALRSARSGARQGDLFAPIEGFVRKTIADLIASPQGALIKASIMDENPLTITVHVNDRYPDEVPLATMPPQLLDVLPRMPEELEYRFVGAHLVILDPHAHLICDVIPQALPE